MSHRGWTRREVLRTGALSGIGAATLGCGEKPPVTHVPVRAVTRGPHFHWFGYYDKIAFDWTGRRLLAARVDFEHRSPTEDDAIEVGMIDLLDSDRWMPIGESRAFGWQQGCMLQWRPGSASEVVWNDRAGEALVARILDIGTDRRRTLPRPIYCLSPDGRFALSADFARIQRMRPGYGYAGSADPHENERAPRESGVWRIDLETGDEELVLSLARVAEIPHRGASIRSRWHYFNHLLVSPDAKRFVVLHRWREHMRHPDFVRSLTGFETRMFTANVDGSDLHLLDPSGHTSHFVWRDPEHICAWTRPEGRRAGFYLFTDRTDRVEPVGAGAMRRDGHNTYLPIPSGERPEWILNDTYPHWRTREQTLYLYHVRSDRKFVLGRFAIPSWRYIGETRCDLHPRASRDGRLVAFDSAHAGGRQVYVADVSSVVGADGIEPPTPSV